MSIEERILRLSMDDGDFQRGADSAISKLDELKAALEFKDISSAGDAATAAFSGITDGIAGLTNTCSNAASSITNVFTDAWSLIYQGFMSTIGSNIANSVVNLVNQCSVAPITYGWAKYEESVNAVQKIVINTGWAIEDVEAKLNILATYSDQTSYGFTDMTNALSSFVSAGNGLDESVNAIMGLSNWAATAGLNAQSAVGAYDMFAKSIQAGYMSLQQWYSLQKTYNMGTVQFYENLKESATAMGMMKENADGTVSVYNKVKGEWDEDKYETVAAAMQNTLKMQWLTDDVLFDVLSRYGDVSEEIMELISSGEVDTVGEAIEKLGIDTESFGYKAMIAAQEAKTLTDTIGAWRDVVSTQYRGVFEDLFGNYEEAADFWTDVCDTLGAFFWDLPGALHDVTSEWHDMNAGIGDNVWKDGYTNYMAFTEGILNICEAIVNLKNAISDAFSNVFGELSASGLADITNNFALFAYQLKNVWLSADNLESITSVIEGLITPFKTLIDLIGAFAGVINDSAKEGSTWTDQWGNVHEDFGWVAALKPILKELGDIIEYVSDAFKDLDEAFRNHDGEVSLKPFDKLVAIFKDVYKIVSELGSLIGQSIGHFLGLDTSTGEGNGLTGAIDSVVDSLKNLFEWIKKLETPMQSLNSWLGENSSKLGLSQNLQTANGDVVDLGHSMENFQVTYEEARDTLSSGSWNLLESIYGGNNPKETWKNIMKEWDSAKKVMPTGEEKVDGMSFGEWLNSQVQSADIDNFTLFVSKIKNAIDQLPDIKETWREFWKGFQGANEEYGFNFPTSLQDFIDDLRDFVSKLKEYGGQDLADAIGKVLPEGTIDTSSFDSFMQSIGHIVGVIAGVKAEWNTDRLGDIGTIFGIIKDVFAIVKEIADQVIQIVSDGKLDSINAEGSAVSAIKSLSTFISDIFKAIAVLVDSIGVAIGATDGSAIKDYSNDLLDVGTVMENLGTIIGNLIGPMLEIFKTIWGFAKEATGQLANATGTDAFGSILESINKTISWIGDLVLDMLTWSNKLLQEGFSESDMTTATGLLSSAMTMIQAVTQPLSAFGSSIISGMASLDSSGEEEGVASGAEALLNAAKSVIDLGTKFAGIITEAAADVAIEVIKSAAKVIIEIVSQLSLISSSISGMGGLSSLANIVAILGEVNVARAIAGLTSLCATFPFQMKMKIAGEWLESYAQAIKDLGVFLLEIIVAIIALGYMATHHLPELLTGFAALVILVVVLTAALIYIYSAFTALVELDAAANSLKAYAMGEISYAIITASLSAIAIFLLGFLAGLIILTAVIAAFKGWGIAGAIVGLIVIAGLIVAFCAALTYIMTMIETSAAKIVAGGWPLLGAVAAYAAILVIVGACITQFILALVTCVVSITAALAIIDTITGKGPEYMLTAIGVLVLVMGVVAVIAYVIIGFLSKMSTTALPSMAEIGKLALIGLLCILVMGAVELLVAGVVGIAASMIALNNLEWQSIFKGIVILIVVAVVLTALVKAIMNIAKAAKAAKLDANQMPEWGNLFKIAFVILMLVLVFRVIIKSIYQLASIDTGNIDVMVLWHVVAIVGVVVAVVYAIFVITKRLDDAGGSKISEISGSLKSMIAMLAVVFSFIILLTYILGKYGTENINAAPLWHMVGIIAVLAIITAGLAAAAKYFLNGTSTAKLAVMLGGLVLCFGMIVLACAILKDIEPIDDAAVDSIMNLVLSLAAIAGIAGVLGVVISLIPGLGELAVALGALFAVAIGGAVFLFAGAVYVLVQAFDKLSQLDGDGLVDAMDSIGEGFDKLFSHDSGIVALATSIAAACGILQPALSGVMSTVGVFAGAVIIAIALIAVAVLATGKDVEDIINIISDVITQVADSMPTWFEQILTAAGDCMLAFTDFLVEYTPMLVQAVLTGFGIAFEQIGAGIGAKGEQWLESKFGISGDNYGTGNSLKQQAWDSAAAKYGFDDKNVGEKVQLVNSAEWYKYSQDQYNELAAQNGQARAMAFDWSGGYVTPSKELNLDTSMNKYAYADWYADYMQTNQQYIKSFSSGAANDLSMFLTDDEMLYFSEHYADLWNKLDFNTDDFKKKAEDAGNDIGEGADALEANADKLARAGEKSKTSAEEGAAALEEGETTFATRLGSFTQLFNELGQTETVEAARNVLMKFNFIDENGNVISDTSTMDSLLSSMGTFGMGATDSEGNTLTTMQGVVDVILTGGKVTFNGQEIGIGTGTVSSAVSSMIESQTATDNTKTTVEITGSTFFNTEDILGDAQTLTTEGPAVYQAAGEALGQAIVSGFESYAGEMNGMGIKYANNAITQFRAQYSYAYWAGVYLAQGFINGMLSMIGEVDAAGQQLGQAGVDGLNKGAGNASPSHKTYQSGIYLAQGSINAMADMTSAVYEAGYEMGSAASDGFADGSSEWNDLISPVINSSYFQNGLDYVDSLYAKAMQYGDYTVTLNGRQYSTKQLIQEAYQEIYNLLYTMSNKDALQWEIQRLGDRLSELGFYVDGKQLTNAISPYMDTALAKAYTKRGRS